jgi:D-lyxose ketol-isomerase
MKRSDLNKIIVDTKIFLEESHFILPPFAYWSPEVWAEKNHEFNEIRDNMMGWDITDFGSGNYSKSGLLMFTIRNGNVHDKKYTKTYGEKLLIIGEEQLTPYHFHWRKMEDIINRGGGNIMVQLYQADETEGLSKNDVTVHVDGRTYTVEAGSIIRLSPGESITIMQYQYHQFWGEKGKGAVLAGEVSEVSNDEEDDRFLEECGRFSPIEEDEKPLYLLYNEYPQAR